MIRLKWHEEIFTADKAVKTTDSVVLYTADNSEIITIRNITPKEWKFIELDGQLTEPEDIPSYREKLQADLDYLTMENEYLEEQAEQYRADIDYCLMLLEEA